jgi:hypothetical protein
MIVNHRIGRIAVAVALIGLGLTLQGCREEEQDRVLSYEKGKYLGKPDTTLSDTQRSELRSRAKSGQKF